MAITADRAFSLVESAYKKGRLAHALLITGSKGSGKEALASKIINLLNGSNESAASGFDLFGEAPAAEPEVKLLDDWKGAYVNVLRPNSKSRIITVDDIRELENIFRSVAPKGTWKVGVVTEADGMKDAASNAFLKTLEEPPNNSLLILITEKPEKLLPTILSRCVRFQLLDDPNAVLAEWMTPLRQQLNQIASTGFGQISQALTLRALFSELLAEQKAILEKRYTLAYKEEVAQYKQTTDGSWLKQREDYYDNMAHAEYLGVRANVIDVLLNWLGQEIVKCHARGELESLNSLIKRMQAVEEMRDTLLNTNALENLTLDVGFLKAFAA